MGIVNSGTDLQSKQLETIEVGTWRCDDDLRDRDQEPSGSTGVKMHPRKKVDNIGRKEIEPLPTTTHSAHITISHTIMAGRRQDRRDVLERSITNRSRIFSLGKGDAVVRETAMRDTTPNFILNFFCINRGL